MVESTTLEMWRPGNGTVGSNPTSSAKYEIDAKASISLFFEKTEGFERRNKVSRASETSEAVPRASRVSTRRRLAGESGTPRIPPSPPD